MARKRKTLPDDIEEIIRSGDMERFKAVFDKCEIGATVRGRTSSNVLSFFGLTLDHVKFLVETGIDLNTDSGWGFSSVYHLANDAEILRYILDNGADIEYKESGNHSFGTALFGCAAGHRAQAVENLLAFGADPEPRGGWNDATALDESLMTCSPASMVSMLRIARALLAAGAKPSDKTKGYVTKIGRDFEFYRDSFDPETVDEHSAALDELYKLFDVEPVPRREKYDGKTRITVKSRVWHKQQAELWDMLVPGNGHANTVQGEVIRICGRVAYELLDNGGINWDEEYRKMIKALPGYFRMADGKEAEKACEAAKISSQSDKNEIYLLTELAVKWVLANPDPIPLEDVDYSR